MRKTLYLHVGHYKTGTTALQVFLSGNRRKLLRRGLDYPNRLLTHAKHSQLAFSIYRQAGVETLMHGYKNPEPAQAVWAQLFDHAAASPAPAILVSTEEFMRMGAHPGAAAILRGLIEPQRDRFDFRIIAYLRAPGAHLRSWYNQLVKMKTAPPDFNTAVTRVMEPVHYDYALALQPWLEIFGADAVTLRPYLPRLRDNGGLHRDFLQVLGLDFDRPPGVGSWTMPDKDVNPRLDDRFVELSRAMQLAGLNEGLQSWLLQRADDLLPAAEADEAAFAAVAARASAGLQALAGLPGNAMPAADFDADPPRADPPWQADLTRMMALLLQEQGLLRSRLQARSNQLAARVEALEQRLEQVPGQIPGQLPGRKP